MNIIFQDQQGEKKANITLEGDLTVGQADGLRMLLIKALIDADHVQVNFGSVTGVDLSCLQLLCSAHRSAGRMKRRLSMSGGWPDLFEKTVKEAGYARFTGCRLDVDHSCLWVKR
jgi:anti-anti-sigma regulatory factor